MAANIVLVGLASSDPVPGVYLGIEFAAGPVSGDGSPLTMIVFANKTSAGSATTNTEIYGPDTQTPLQSETDMIALAGPGSEAHRLFLRMAPINNVTSTYWVFVTESAGTAATGTVTITGPATSAGVVKVWVGDEFIEAAFASAATATDIAAAIVAAVNAKTHWPCTASNAAGVVTLTSKQKGPRGNDIRYQARVMQGGGITASASADTAMTGGTTLDDNTAAIAMLKGRGDYYLVSAASDATNVGRLLAHVNTMALPTNGVRKRLFAGSSDTLANTNTIAIGLNAERSEVPWQFKSDWTPGELAAHHAAIYALEESTTEDPRTNFCGYGTTPATQAIYRVPPPRDKSAWPSRTDIGIALNNGVTPVAVDSRGARCYLVDRITTRSLQGAVADYRIRDAHKVTICDFWARDFVAKTALQFSGMRVGDDTPPGTPPPGPKVVTPKRWQAASVGLIDRYAGNDLLQQVAKTKAESVFQRSPTNPSRLECRVPLAPIDNAKQFAALVQQVA